MKFPKLFVENGKTAAEILLDVLKEEQVITEGAFKRMTAKQMITESFEDEDHNIVTIKGKDVYRDMFHAAYSNVRLYPTKLDVAKAIGFNGDDFGAERRRKDNLNKFFERLTSRFNAKRYQNQEEFPRFSKRREFYSQPEEERGDTMDASIEDIDAGSRAKRDRSTRTVEKINSEDLLNGEFYANRTRIPKTRGGSSLRFWVKSKKTSVSRDKSIFGREWGKSFIIGYQVDRNVLYEIWYNSIDSTFTVHDYAGNEVSNRLKTMTEAIKGLVSMISQTSSSDAQVFRGTTQQNKQLAQSIQRALYTDLDKRANELEDIDRKKQKESRKENAMKIKRRRAAQQKAKNMFKSADKEANTSVGEDPQSEDSRNQPEREFRRNPRNEPSEATRRKADAAMKRDAKRKEDMDKAADEKRREQFMRDIPSMGNDDDTEFGIDVPRFASDADKRKLAKLKKERKKAKEKSEKQRKKAETPEEREERIQRELQQTRERIRREDSPLDDVVTESFDGEDFDDQLEQKLDSSQYDSQIKSIKKQADNSPYTQSTLNQTVMGELVTTYDQTRVSKSFFDKKYIRAIGKGRKEPIVKPTDKPFIWERFKMALKGQRHRADFVIGWALGNKVNLEIWYITEPHPDYDGSQSRQKTVSSFYVFDVTSKTVVRKYLPYYRNAVQVILGKIGAF